MDKFEILKVASKNLKHINNEDLYKLIALQRLSNIAIFNIPHGTNIYRFRKSESIPFQHVSQISYNAKGGEMGRANKKGEIRFYGSFNAPNKVNPLLTNALEALNILKNSHHKFDGNEVEFTCGKWIIQKPMPTFPIVFYDEYLEKNEFFKPLVQNYLKQNKYNTRNIELIKFFADEFAKNNISDSDDYKITATLTEFLFSSYKEKVESLIYPSVRNEGKGFNIALSKGFVDEYLKLDSVFIIKMYYKNEFALFNFELTSETINSDGTFKFVPIKKDGVTKSKEKCLEQLDKLVRGEISTPNFEL